MAEKDFKVEVRLRNILGGVLIGIVVMTFLGLIINPWGLFPTPTIKVAVKVAVGLVTICVGGALLIK